LVSGRSRACTWIGPAVPMVQLRAMKQGMGSVVQESQGDVPADISQHGVIAHWEGVLGVVHKITKISLSAGPREWLVSSFRLPKAGQN
jgi:hypothetical protein